MQLEGNRIILRPWKKTDAEALYNICNSEEFEKCTGYRRSTSVSNALNDINHVLDSDGYYAIVLKSNLKVIGMINCRVGALGIYGVADNEADLDYWVVKKYWYEDYTSEAIELILDYCFNSLGLRGVWSGYFVGNDEYFYCQKKCGFSYHHTEYDKIVLGYVEPKTINLSYILKEDYLKRKS